jgi:hypothetical protein
MIMGNHPFKDMLDVIYLIDHCHKLLKVIEHCQITGKNKAKDKIFIFYKGRCHSQERKAKRNFSYCKISKLLFLTIMKTFVGQRTIMKTFFGQCTIMKIFVGQRTIMKTSVGQRTIMKTSVGQRTIMKTFVGQHTIMKTSVGQRVLQSW